MIYFYELYVMLCSAVLKSLKQETGLINVMQIVCGMLCVRENARVHLKTQAALTVSWLLYLRSIRLILY